MHAVITWNLLDHLYMFKCLEYFLIHYVCRHIFKSTVFSEVSHLLAGHSLRTQVGIPALVEIIQELCRALG